MPVPDKLCGAKHTGADGAGRHVGATGPSARRSHGICRETCACRAPSQHRHGLTALRCTDCAPARAAGHGEASVSSAIAPAAWADALQWRGEQGCAGTALTHSYAQPPPLATCAIAWPRRCGQPCSCMCRAASDGQGESRTRSHGVGRRVRVAGRAGRRWDGTHP